jgi:hypothetical protein
MSHYARGEASASASAAYLRCVRLNQLPELSLKMASWPQKLSSGGEANSTPRRIS